MLIIEGSDCVGKTTVINKLQQVLAKVYKLPYKYQHLGLLPITWDYYQDYIKIAKPNIIQDRFHMSEVVYSTVARKISPKISPLQYELVDAYLRQIGGFTVIMSAEEDWLKHQMFKDDRPQVFDGRVLLQANALFTAIGQLDYDSLEQFGLDGYTIDTNLHLHLSDGFLGDGDIEYIAEQYIRRFLEISKLRSTYEH